MLLESKQNSVIPLVASNFYKAQDQELIVHPKNYSGQEVSAQILVRKNSPTEFPHRVLCQQLDQEIQSYQCHYPKA